jgi:hypothetical protein
LGLTLTVNLKIFYGDKRLWTIISLQKYLSFSTPFIRFHAAARSPPQGAREMESGSESDAPEELTAGEVIS